MEGVEVVFESGHGQDGLFYRVVMSERGGRFLVSVLQSVGDEAKVYGSNRGGVVGWLRSSLPAAKLKGEYELKLLRARSAARPSGA